MAFEILPQVDGVILAGMGSLLLSLALSCVSLAKAFVKGGKKR